MNSILAICLTAVFAGWVWYLKMQVSELMRHAKAPVEDPSAQVTAPHLIHIAAPAEKRARIHAEPAARHREAPVHVGSCNREGGIPTWTITV
jgi:hypothetical protein